MADLQRRTPLTRGAQLKARRTFQASESQRKAVSGSECIVCGATPVDPAHLISRALGGGDDPLDVAALCRMCHSAYDDGRLSLLEYLEPRHREQVAQAVRHVGLVRALEELTNERWQPTREAA